MEQIIAAIMAFVTSITGHAIPANIAQLSSNIPAAHAPANPAKPISAERAFQIAYGHARVNGAHTFDRDAELDRENGRLVWNIDFDTRTHEYEYDIDAYTGRIIHFEHERD